MKTNYKITVIYDFTYNTQYSVHVYNSVVLLLRTCRYKIRDNSRQTYTTAL